MRLSIYYIIPISLVFLASSCTHSKQFTHTYYQENEATLHSIKQRFKILYDKNPFSLELKDKDLGRIGLEIHTDTVKYIYSFRLDEPYLLDTLYKYGFDVQAMNDLINDMQKTRCTWITNLDYYEKRKKKYLVFISVRDKKLTGFMKPEKYFTLAFFDQPQPYDAKQRLLDYEDLSKNRLINGAVFRKVNDTVSYALTGKYR